MLNKQPLLLLLFLPPFLPPSPQSYLKLKFPYTIFYEIKITLIVRTLTINKKHTLCNNKIARKSFHPFLPRDAILDSDLKISFKVSIHKL